MKLQATLVIEEWMKCCSCGYKMRWNTGKVVESWRVLELEEGTWSRSRGLDWGCLATSPYLICRRNGGERLTVA